MNRRSPSVVLGGLVLLLALGVAYRTWRTAEPLQVLTLSDGSVLRVDGIAWQGHPYRREPGLWTRFKRALPQGLRRWVGVPRDPILHDSSGLTCLLTQIAPPTNGTTRSDRLPLEHLNAAGQTLPPADRHWTTGVPGEQRLTFTAVWWREERLRFRLADGSQKHEFSVPNPRRGEEFPQWQPEPVPAVRTFGDLELVCTGLRPSPAFEPFQKSFPVWWQPGLEVRLAGATDLNWYWWQTQMRDPLGSAGAITPGETVVHVKVRAVPQAGVPERAGRVRHRWPVRVPEPQELVELAIPEALAKEGLRHLWISGPGKFRFRAESVRCLGPLSEREAHLAAGVFKQCATETLVTPDELEYFSLVPAVWWLGVRPRQLPADASGNREEGHWVMQFLPGEGGPPVESAVVTGGSPNYQVFWDHNLAWQVQGDSLLKISPGQSLVIQLLEAPILKAEFTLPVPTAPPPTHPR